MSERWRTKCKHCNGKGTVHCKIEDGIEYVADCLSCDGTGKSADGQIYYEMEVL